ncbi:MAG: Gx transporter family protein [Clostridia bacterium]|nr:Gx transporter family protein [Clostridia bacterium]
MKKNSNDKVFRIAATGILCALALAFSFAEKMLLTAFPLPMGIKPGLSNIIVMFTCSTLGLVPALGLALGKAVFASFLSGASAGFISLCGGIFSVLTMYVTLRISKGRISYTGISVMSSVMHNTGQLTAASVIAGSPLFAGFYPVLLISGIIFGTVTGITLNVTMPYLKKLKIFNNHK